LGKRTVPPTGHVISGAIQAHLGIQVILPIRGPFLCFDEQLYLPRPLHFFQGSPLVPISWLDDQDSYRQCVWDPTRPAPLVSLHTDIKGSAKDKGAAYFPQTEIVKLLKGGSLDLITGVAEPRETEIRPHNTLKEGSRQVKKSDGYFVETCIRLKPGWSLAVSVEVLNLKTQNSLAITKPTAVRLGGEGYQAILTASPELGSQWQKLQEVSEKTRTKNSQ